MTGAPDPQPSGTGGPKRFRRTELDAPASPAQRLLTIVVAPFVIGWLAITSIGRAIRRGGLRLLVGLDRFALSVWRRSRLLLAIVGGAFRQVGDAFRQVGAVVWRGLAAVAGAVRDGIGAVWRPIRQGIGAIWGAIRDGLAAAWGAFRHGVGALWGATWGTIRPVLARMGMVVRGAWAAVKRAGWAVAHAAAPILRRAGILVRGLLYSARDGIRAGWHTLTQLLRRVGLVLKGLARPIGSAIRLGFRTVFELLRRWAVVLKGGLMAVAHALRALGRAIKGLLVRLWAVVKLAWRSTLGVAFRWSIVQLRRLWIRLILALRVAWVSFRWIALHGLRAFGDSLLLVGGAVTWSLRRGFLALSSAWRFLERGLTRLLIGLTRGLKWLMAPIAAAVRTAIHAVVYRIAAPLLRGIGRAIRDTVDRVLPGVGRLVRAVWTAIRAARANLGRMARSTWAAARSARTTIMRAARSARASLSASMRSARAGIRHTVERQRESWRALRARFTR